MKKPRAQTDAEIEQAIVKELRTLPTAYEYVWRVLDRMVLRRLSTSALLNEVAVRIDAAGDRQ